MTKYIEEEKQPKENWDWDVIWDLVPYSVISEILILMIFSFLLFSGKVVKGGIKDWQEKLDILSEQDESLKEECIKLLTFSKADRVLVGEFSNGEASFTGNSFLKLRFRQEAKLPGLQPIRKIIGKNTIELDNIKEEINLLFREGHIFVKDINDDSLAPTCRYHLYETKAKAFFEEILNYERTPIGVIAFYFSHPVSQEELSRIKDSSLYEICKQGIVETLYPKKSIFSRIVNFFYWIF